MTAHIASCRNAEGFTLLEIVIAMAIFAVGVLATATMQISAVKGNARGRDYSEATTIAMERVEQLLTRSWTHPDIQDANGNGVAGLDNGMEPVPQAPDFSEVMGRYQVFWNVADNQFAPETKTLALYVQWREQGENRTVRMRNIIPWVH